MAKSYSNAADASGRRDVLERDVYRQPRLVHVVRADLDAEEVERRRRGDARGVEEAVRRGHHEVGRDERAPAPEALVLLAEEVRSDAHDPHHPGVLARRKHLLPVHDARLHGRAEQLRRVGRTTGDVRAGTARPSGSNHGFAFLDDAPSGGVRRLGRPVGPTETRADARARERAASRPAASRPTVSSARVSRPRVGLRVRVPGPEARPSLRPRTQRTYSGRGKARREKCESTSARRARK